MTNFNERMNTLLYKNIPHTLFSKGWCFLCVRGELETGTDCYILTQSSSNHSSTSFASWLGCSTMGHWGLKPSVWSWFSLCWHLISNWLKQSVSWLYLLFVAHLLLLLIYTGASLDWRLGRGSICNSWHFVFVVIRILFVVKSSNQSWNKDIWRFKKILSDR